MAETCTLLRVPYNCLSHFIHTKLTDEEQLAVRKTRKMFTYEEKAKILGLIEEGGWQYDCRETFGADKHQIKAWKSSGVVPIYTRGGSMSSQVSLEIAFTILKQLHKGGKTYKQILKNMNLSYSKPLVTLERDILSLVNVESIYELRAMSKEDFRSQTARFESKVRPALTTTVAATRLGISVSEFQKRLRSGHILVGEGQPLSVLFRAANNVSMFAQGDVDAAVKYMGTVKSQESIDVPVGTDVERCSGNDSVMASNEFGHCELEEHVLGESRKIRIYRCGEYYHLELLGSDGQWTKFDYKKRPDWEVIHVLTQQLGRMCEKQRCGVA